MENKEAVDVITDVLIRLEGGINMLVDGKQVPAYQRLTGVKDKLSAFRADLIGRGYALSDNLKSVSKDS